MAKEIQKEMDSIKQQAAEILLVSKKIKKDNLIRATIQTELHVVTLTDEELLEAGANLAQALVDGNVLGSEKKQITSSYAAKLKEVTGKVDNLRMLVKNKNEMRKVDCVEVMDNSSGLVFVVRMDTGSIVRERKMTSDERQSKIIWPDEVEKVEEVEVKIIWPDEVEKVEV
jgi:hypothetical protein